MKAQYAQTRRDFLRRAGAAAAVAGFPTLIPATALGRGGIAAPSERILIGCIGLGGQGQHDMQAMIHQPDTQVLALCDVERGTDTRGLEPALRELVKNYRDLGRPVAAESVARHHDFRELLAREDLDAVTVTTPDHWHGLISAAAARAGKDIYCEKPLVNTIVEGRAVCDAVEQCGRILQTGSHERSNDTVRYAWELVHNGRIGDLREIVVHLPFNEAHHQAMRRMTSPPPLMAPPDSLDYDFWLGPAPSGPYTPKRVHGSWRFVQDTGGGEITDRGAHVLDLVQFIHGSDRSGPVEIAATGQRIGSSVYDCFVDYQFECRYADGVRLLGYCDDPRGLKLVGTKGWIFIHIHGGQLEAEPASLLREAILPSELHTERSPGHQRNFLDCVKSRRRPLAYHEIGHRTATLCHLLNIAMTVGRPLKWDPVRECITNDPVADRMTARPMRAPWSLGFLREVGP
jgi:predicted dehydrogenase